jgi:hypothetical protein
MCLKLFNTLIAFLFVLNLHSQKVCVKDEIKKGTTYLLVSSFPYIVATQTFNSNLPQQTKNLYGGVWFGFGVFLDLGAIHHYYRAIKIRKEEKKFLPL